MIGRQTRASGREAAPLEVHPVGQSATIVVTTHLHSKARRFLDRKPMCLRLQAEGRVFRGAALDRVGAAQAELLKTVEVLPFVAIVAIVAT